MNLIYTLEHNNIAPPKYMDAGCAHLRAVFSTAKAARAAVEESLEGDQHCQFCVTGSTIHRLAEDCCAVHAFEVLRP